MNNQNSLVTWLAIAVIALGIVAIVAMTMQSSPEPVALPTKIPGTPTPSPTIPTATPTVIPTVALPTATFTPIPLKLAEIDPPPGGAVYMLQPAYAGAVGWARSGDAQPNHFGDFNIYRASTTACNMSAPCSLTSRASRRARPSSTPI